MRFKYIVLFFAMQCFSLFSYEFSYGDNNHHNAHVETHANYEQHTQPTNNWHFSVRATVIPDCSSMQAVHHSVIAQQAAPALKNYFTTIVAPLIYNATINNHYVVIPGYTCAHGLRDCIKGLLQFSRSDAALITNLTKRLGAYCARIESIIFGGKNHEFCETISDKNRIKLVKLYANFLQEFYGKKARDIFEEQSKNSSLMRQVMPSITWGCYEISGTKCFVKKIKKQYTASVNGNLGLVYKALHAGNSTEAYTIGRQQVKTVVRGEKTVISVFERYPALQKKVELLYFADKAKAKQESIAKQAKMQQDAASMKANYDAQADEQLFQRHQELLESRYDAATTQYYNSQFFKTLHKVLERQADHIDVQHLTSDQKGILFEGGYLQHHLIDEAISVVDVAISVDVTEKIKDAVLDLANTSISLNKDGDVLMASNTLDVCWAFIDYAQDAACDTYAMLSTHAPVVKGMCDGVYESLHGAVQTVCNPVQAAQDAVESFTTLGYCLGKVAYTSCALEAACDMFESDPKRYEEMISQYAIDPNAFLAMYEHVKENISLEAVARVGTKTAVDMMLLHGATKAVSAITQEFWVELISCMRKEEQLAEVALTAEKIPLQSGQEIASLMNSTEKVGGGAKATRIKCPEDIAKKIRNVGDDILDVMEKVGGHTLERHVAKTNADLIKRIAKSTLTVKNASTFMNKRTAIKAVRENLRNNADAIASWIMTNPGLDKKKAFDFLHSYHIGKGILKSKNTPYDLIKSRVVLIPNFFNELGFDILTAFPIPH